jgi:membrane fusion protein (multidrug efflux system)
MTDDVSFRSRVTSAAAARARILVPLVLVVVAVVGGLWWHYAGRESTDDAQLDGHITQISAKVGGTVVRVAVSDNEAVPAGTVLVEIDPRDYQVAVTRAEAELAAARAAADAATVGVPIARTETSSGVTSARGGVEQAQAAVATAEHEIEAANARLASAQAVERQRRAEATRTGRDVERFKGLVAKDEIPQQQYDAAVSANDAAQAAVEAAGAAVREAMTAVNVAQARAVQARAGAAQARASLRTANTAPEQVKVTRAQADVALARMQQAEAALAQAKLNLEYAVVKAPAAGIVSRKTVEVGQVVQAGQPLLALVNTENVWVTANFKETQLRDMRVGQRVSVEVDALGGKSFEGHIQSIAAATGARFSLLPPENATGNYVKVVQRVPVKIVLAPGQDPERRLRPGMSVIPVVHLR